MLLDIVFLVFSFAAIIGTVAGVVALIALDQNLRGK